MSVEHSNNQQKPTEKFSNREPHELISAGEHAGQSPIGLFQIGNPQLLKPHDVLQMQRQFGNRATARMLQRVEDEQAPEEKIDPLTIQLNAEQFNTARAIFRSLPNWNDLKAMYIDNPESRNLRTMAELWAFRRKYIVDLFRELKTKEDGYPNLIAKSAGSTDLSSDYDITVSSPGDAKDLDAIDEFNNTIKGEFGVQPGTLFDTNLYARDFGEIKPSEEFADFMSAPPTVDTLPNENQKAMEEDVTDVGALIKLRRYMNQTEWDAYVNDLVSKLDGSKKAAVRRRYDEADAVYQIAVSELLSVVTDGLDETENLATAQSENSERLSTAEHENSDKVLEESNKMYTAKMREIREIEATVRELEQTKGDLNILQRLGGGIMTLVNKLMDKPDKGIQSQIDAKKTQIKQLLSQAIFFAAEAYNSEGAIKHVVAGIQGNKLSDEEKALPDHEQARLKEQRRKQANDKLTLNHLQQSFNEQLGDFLKDFGHLARASDGKFYIKSSKYVWRMLDAALIVKERMGEEFPDDQIKAVLADNTIEEFKTKIDELYSARGNPQMWEPERDAKSVERMTDLGITSRGAYKATLLSLGSTLGAVMRNQMPGAVSKQEETTFFHNI